MSTQHGGTSGVSGAPGDVLERLHALVKSLALAILIAFTCGLHTVAIAAPPSVTTPSTWTSLPQCASEPFLSTYLHVHTLVQHSHAPFETFKLSGILSATVQISLHVQACAIGGG